MMSELPQSAGAHSGRWLRVVLWVVLGTLALVHLAYDLLDQMQESGDNTYQETTLVLVAAGQFADGPGALYGPYRGSNHRVLMHAPLYYRLVGLLARPMVHSAPQALVACATAGRLLTFAAFAACLAAVHALAVVDGAPGRAGACAAALAASSRIVGTYSATVRPDMLGVAFQTVGALVVLRALHRAEDRPRGLSLAALAFALAFFTKQHDVSVAAVSMALSSHASLTRPTWRRPVLQALLLGLAAAVCYYTVEEVLTSGQMSRSVFLFPREFQKLAPGGWYGAFALFFGCMLSSEAILALGVAARVARPPGSRATSVDRLIWLYLGAEIALTLLLFSSSQGAWINYAIQCVLFASVLVGRMLAPATVPTAFQRRQSILVVAAVAILVLDFWHLNGLFKSKIAEIRNVLALRSDTHLAGRDRSRIYFAGLPEYNRMLGRFDLVHDEWLYGLYERVRAAEPRSLWLRPALVHDVSIVVVPTDPPFSFPTDPPIVPGTTETLPELGYDLIVTVGHYTVWERRRAPKSVMKR